MRILIPIDRDRVEIANGKVDYTYIVFKAHPNSTTPKVTLKRLSITDRWSSVLREDAMIPLKIIANFYYTRDLKDCLFYIEVIGQVGKPLAVSLNAKPWNYVSMWRSPRSDSSRHTTRLGSSIESERKPDQVLHSYLQLYYPHKIHTLTSKLDLLVIIPDLFLNTKTIRKVQ